MVCIVFLAAYSSKSATDLVVVRERDRILNIEGGRTRITVSPSVTLRGTRIPRTVTSVVNLNELLGNVYLLVCAAVDVNLGRKFIPVL